MTKKRLVASIDAERKLILQALGPVVAMVGRFVGPHLEVVLHDLTQRHESVAALANSRAVHHAVGAAIQTAAREDRGLASLQGAIRERGEAAHAVLPDYLAPVDSGPQRKSAAVIFRDASAAPFAALCLNADLAHFQLLHHWLGGMLGGTAFRQDALGGRPEMDTLMGDIIDDAVHCHGKPVALMSRKEKIQAVQTMQHRGLFVVRGSVEKAAVALGVSRFTVYNYLDALKRRDTVTG